MGEFIVIFILVTFFLIVVYAFRKDKDFRASFAIETIAEIVFLFGKAVLFFVRSIFTK